MVKQEVKKVIWTSYGSVAIDLEQAVPHLIKAVTDAEKIVPTDEKEKETKDELLKGLRDVRDIADNWRAYCSDKNRNLITE